MDDLAYVVLIVGVVVVLVRVVFPRIGIHG